MISPIRIFSYVSEDSEGRWEPIELSCGQQQRGSQTEFLLTVEVRGVSVQMPLDNPQAQALLANLQEHLNQPQNLP